MTPEPTPLIEVPPGAWILSADGLPRRLWFVPPATLITLNPATGQTTEAVLTDSDASTAIVLMYVPTDDEAIRILTAVFSSPHHRVSK